jgi:hypothetical protein
VSKTWDFRQIHHFLLEKYGTVLTKLDIVDQFMNMRSDDIHFTLAWCYQSLSRVWLTLGFRPDINNGLHCSVMKNIHGIPDDIINLIASFIPEQNYGDIADPYKVRSEKSLVLLASAINFLLLFDDIPPSRSTRNRLDDIRSIFYEGLHNYCEVPDINGIVTRHSQTDLPRYPGDYVFPPDNNVPETLNNIYPIILTPINYLAPGLVYRRRRTSPITVYLSE